jgi:hypothetical protein
MEDYIEVSKRDYTRKQVYFLKNRFRDLSNSNSILILYGEEEELQKVVKAANLTDEQFKEYFPEFLNEEAMKKELEAYGEIIKGIEDKLSALTEENNGKNDFVHLTSLFELMNRKYAMFKDNI